jgi:hypothetical protein
MPTIGHTRQEWPQPLWVLGIGKPCIPILNGQDVPHRACGWPVASDTFHQAGSVGSASDAGPPP